MSRKNILVLSIFFLASLPLLYLNFFSGWWTEDPQENIIEVTHTPSEDVPYLTVDSTTSNGSTTIKNKEYGFQISFPKGWKVIPRERLQPDIPFNDNLKITAESNDERAYFLVAVTALEEGQTYETITAGLNRNSGIAQYVIFNGKEAIFDQFMVRDQVQTFLYFINGGYLYMLEGVASRDFFESKINDFHLIDLSFSLLEGS